MEFINDIRLYAANAQQFAGAYDVFPPTKLDIALDIVRYAAKRTLCAIVGHDEVIEEPPADPEVGMQVLEVTCRRCQLYL